MKPKFRLFSDGKHTCVELGGKTIGKGITSISFEHDAKRPKINAKIGEKTVLNVGGEESPTKIELSIDLDDFEFEEDGYFDKVYKMLLEREPLEIEELPSGLNNHS